MKDPRIKAVEVELDLGLTDADKDNRIAQLKKQRRRAIRRALSMQGCIERLLKVAVSGTPEEIEKVIEDCRFVINVPLQTAMTRYTDEEGRFCAD